MRWLRFPKLVIPSSLQQVHLRATAIKSKWDRSLGHVINTIIVLAHCMRCALHSGLSRVLITRSGVIMVESTTANRSDSAEATSALPLVKQLSSEHDLVLKTFRLLISDLCQQFNGGHPG